MKLDQKQKSVLIPVVSAVLVIGAGIVAYWVISSKGRLSNAQTGANAIPQEAMMAISVSTNADQWQKLGEFGTQESKKTFDETIGQLRDRLLTNNGIDYEKDIKPWVGKEITIAFLPPPASQPNQVLPGPQSVVMVLPIDNQQQAKQTLEQPKEPAGGKWVDRTYKGIKIKETQGTPPDRTISAAVLDGRFLTISNEPKAIDRAIDTYQGGYSLATTPGYAEALEKIKTTQSFARIYFNVPVGAAYLSINSAQPIPEQNLAKLQKNWQGFATTINLEPEGILFKGISWLKPNSEQKLVVENNSKIMPSRLPADTLMMISGGNLQRLWQDYSQTADSSPIAPIKPEWLKTAIRTTTTLDIDKDLMPWMAGEFSLALISPEQQKNKENLSLGLALMIQSNDRRNAEKSFKQLDEILATKYKVKVTETKVKEQPVTQLTSPLGGVNFFHGWLDGNIAFLTVGETPTNAIVPKPDTSFASTEQFQKFIPSGLTPNNGQFFIDIDRIFNQGKIPFLQLPPNQKNFMEAINSIGVTSAISSDRSTRYDLFIRLKKETNTPPAPTPQPTPNTNTTPSPSPQPTPNTNTTPSPSPQTTPNTNTTPSPSPQPTPNTNTTPTPSPQPTPNTDTTPTPQPTPNTNTDTTPTPQPTPNTNTNTDTTPTPQPTPTPNPTTSPSP